jgi:hypothetical protein
MPGTDTRAELIGHLLDSLTTSEKVAVGFLIVAAFGLGVWLGTWVTERRIDNAIFESKQQIQELKGEVQRLKSASVPLKGTGSAAPSLDDAATKPDMSRYANGVFVALCIVVLGLIATWLAVSRQGAKSPDIDKWQPSLSEPALAEPDFESMPVEQLSLEDYLALQKTYMALHADKTDLQRRAFYQIYAGKRYQFAGAVNEVFPAGEGEATLRLCSALESDNPVPRSADYITCFCGSKQREALQALKKGGECTVTGIMSEFGTLDDCRLVTA